MGCMADYDEDCNGKRPEGCMCLKCCEEACGIKDEDDFNESKCVHCGKEITLDFEGDLIHVEYIRKGVDPRLCEPGNPESKIASR